MASEPKSTCRGLYREEKLAARGPACGHLLLDLRRCMRAVVRKGRSWGLWHVVRASMLRRRYRTGKIRTATASGREGDVETGEMLRRGLGGREDFSVLMAVGGGSQARGSCLSPRV